MNEIKTEIEKTLAGLLGLTVKVTFRGSSNGKLEFTLSGNQYDTAQAAGFMVNRGLAQFQESVSYIDDPDIVYFYLAA